MDAASFVSQFRRESPGPAETIEKLYGVGYWLLEQERYADAALAFRTMVRAAPTDERSWLALGICHERAGQLRIALELYGAGTAVIPTSVRCHVARARLLRDLNRHSQADDAIENAAERARDSGNEELLRLVDAEKEDPCH